VKEWVRVVAWVREPSSLYIYPSLHGGEFCVFLQSLPPLFSLIVPPKPLSSTSTPPVALQSKYWEGGGERVVCEKGLEVKKK
jgi:hypothetical protein